MSQGKTVLEKRVELALLLSEAQLNILNTLLQDAVDWELEEGNEDGLNVLELELLTTTHPIVLVMYEDVSGEDHSELGEVTFSEYGMEDTYSVEIDWLRAIIETGKTGYFYWADCYYLVITPRNALDILGNHKENWEGLVL